MSWYALFVETGAEDTVEQYLYYHFDKSKCHPVIPKRRLTEVRKGKCYHVTRTLFPGYVLINIDMNIDIYQIIRNIPKVYTILNQGGELCSLIDEAEMEPILKLIKENNVIDYSKIFIENSMVYVASGPLMGMDGLIKKVDKRRHRAKVALDFMGSQKIIDLGIEILSMRPIK